jgi:hypothetical protein
MGIGRIVNGHHIGGRKRPATRHLMGVRRYLAGGAELPAAPASFDYTGPAATALAQILANDRLGDCTAAGRSHIIDAVTAGAGAAVDMTEAQTIAFYSVSTGYNPADPSTDQGGDEITVLTCWQNQGGQLDGHAIAGFLSVDPSNAAHVKSCCWLFENLYFGLELADPWTQVSGNGFVWDVGSPPDPNDGHCVVGLGGDDSGITIDSWGFLGKITYAAIAQFCAEAAGGNLFVVLTQEAVNRAQKKAPNGFDWAGLVADFDGLGGTIPAPPPSTQPAPDPDSTGPFVNDSEPPLGPAGGVSSR